jgi:farnesyl diphosphate synthase
MAVYECYRAFAASDQIAANGSAPATLANGKANGVECEREVFLAHTLGWCVEFLQAFFLVADDIMDDSVTRRGQPCFYRLPEIGLKAINDSLILELMIYRILKRHMRQHPEYLAVVELFQEITYITEMGQLLDLTSQKTDGVVDLKCFTSDILLRIYRYKTSHYSFYLPVALGMRLAGVQDEAKYATAKRICLAMGEYFQAQDDYIDCFGDPALTGKVGTDIEDNKCTWLVVEALKHATEGDRAVLVANYAKKDEKAVSAIKDLYRRLKVPEAFAEYEQKSFEKIKGMIDDVTDMPTGAFTFLLAKIYKRDK